MPSTGKKKKTQRWCFVPGCDAGYKSCGERLSLFRAPAREDEFEKWARAIPRADKPLQENSAVCERHFDPRYVWNSYMFKHIEKLRFLQVNTLTRCDTRVMSSRSAVERARLIQMIGCSCTYIGMLLHVGAFCVLPPSTRG